MICTPSKIVSVRSLEDMQISAAGVFIAVTGALCLGFASGWWYRDLTDIAEATKATAVPWQASTNTSPPAPRRPPAATAEPAPHAIEGDRQLEALLAEHRFVQATAFYYDAVRADPANRSLLRPTVDAFFRHCSQNCDSGTFFALVDAWLATFYDDIPVLLTLAEYQEGQGQPEASANTLFLARTYALRAGEQRAVKQALGQLTRRTDDRLAENQRWIELVGYYEYLAAIDFTTRDFELRRALLYRRLGEQARGDELLAALLAADDGRSPEWTATLERHLAEAVPESAPGVELSSAIPLQRHGDGYLVEVTLNDRARLQLLVDTGASMTALTRESFNRQARHDFSLRGTRLFNTATGYTRGDVYRASAITLGQERLEGIDIAVLDFPTMGDIDGLLGMNVLRQFGFEIDQSSAVMYLDRR